MGSAPLYTVFDRGPRVCCVVCMCAEAGTCWLARSLCRKGKGGGCCLCLCRGLVLIRHPLGRHRVLAADVLLLMHVLLVGHLLLLFRGDVSVLRHPTSSTGHVCLRGGDLLVVHFFGGLDVRFAVDAVFTALWWFGCVEACLQKMVG